MLVQPAPDPPEDSQQIEKSIAQAQAHSPLGDASRPSRPRATSNSESKTAKELSQHEIIKAGLHIRNALHGKFQPLESNNERALHLYWWLQTRRFSYCMSAFLLAVCLTPFFECPYKSIPTCFSGNRRDDVALLCIDVVCLLIIAAHQLTVFLLETGFKNFRTLTRWHFSLYANLLFCIIDTLIALSQPPSYAFPSICMRPYIAILALPDMCRVLRLFWTTATRLGVYFAVYCSFILVTGILVVQSSIAVCSRNAQDIGSQVRCEEIKQNLGYLGPAMRTVYILMMGDGAPDRIGSLTDESEATSFIPTFIWLIGTLLLTSVFTAAVFEAFRHQVAETSKELRSVEVCSLASAFDMLSCDKACLQKETLEEVMKVVSRPITRSEGGAEILFDLLDQDQSGEIGAREFMRLFDLLQLRVRLTLNSGNRPSSIKAKLRYISRQIDRNARSRWLWNTAMLLQFATTLSESMFPCYDDKVSECPAFNLLNATSFVLFCILALELTVKGLSRGRSFWADGFHRFDLLVCLVEGVFFLLTLAYRCYACTTTLRFFRYARVLRGARSLSLFRELVSVLLKITHAVTRYLLYSLAVLVFFATVGIMAFGNANDPILTGWEAASFENLPKAILLCLQLTVMSNFDTISNAVAEKNGESSFVWFAFFSLTLHLYVVNILVSLSIEIFQHQSQREQLQKFNVQNEEQPNSENGIRDQDQHVKLNASSDIINQLDVLPHVACAPCPHPRDAWKQYPSSVPTPRWEARLRLTQQQVTRMIESQGEMRLETPQELHDLVLQGGGTHKLANSIQMAALLDVEVEQGDQGLWKHLRLNTNGLWLVWQQKQGSPSKHPRQGGQSSSPNKEKIVSLKIPNFGFIEAC